MADGAYQQKKINAQKTFKEDPKIDAEIELSVSKDNKIVSFIMRQISGNEKIIYRSQVDGKKYISIRNNSKIAFILSDQIAWRWSDEFDAITTKEPREQFYGYLEYSENAAYSVMVGIERKGFRRVSFYAKSDKNGIKGTVHGFSLNVDLQQADGSWLPITIDPDIKNPPPIGDDDDGRFIDWQAELEFHPLVADI